MRRLNPLLLLLILAITIQIAWYCMLTVSYIRADQVVGSDFRWFYAVGTVWRQYGPGKVYDLRLAGITQAQVAGVPVGSERILLPNHPPFVFPVMALLAGLAFRSAYLLNFILVWLITASVMVGMYRSLRKRGWPRFEALAFFCGVLLFEPFFMSVLKGQDTYLLLVGGLFLFFGFLEERDWLAGLGLGLMLIRPQIALVLALPFLFRKRTVWWWFIAAAFLLGVYSFIQVGWNGARDYVAILKLSTGVQGFGWDEPGMFDSVGMLLRVAPGLGAGLIHDIGWGCYGAVLAGLCLLWWRAKTVQFRHLSLAVTLSLFAAPHLHYHDLALLAVPLAGLGIVAVIQGRFSKLSAALIPMSASLILLFSEFWEPARLSVPYLLMAGVPALTWRLERET